MAPWWNGVWACPVGKVRHVTSSWVGACHIFIALTPQGEPGADGAAGKEVPLRWVCSFPVGMLLLAPCFALAPLFIQ